MIREGQGGPVKARERKGDTVLFLPWVIEPKYLLYIIVVLENEHIFSYT